MSWVAVRVRPGRDRQAVLDALFAGGSLGVQELGDELQTFFPSDIDRATLEQRIRQASDGAEVTISSVADVDWVEAWRHGIQPQHLGALDVVPPWLAEGCDPARTIIIEPAMAFGTGDHPTTRGVIRLLQSVLRPGDRVADLGAGSGILAIAAAKLGASRVAAIELDPDAIGNAEENVARNGVGDRVSVIEGDAAMLLPLVAPVDLVLANIVSSVLIALLPAMRDALASGGHVILSGILLEEREGMVHTLADAGWTVCTEDAEEAWWTLLARPR